MREVDFRHLQSALESLNSSTDLVLVRGPIMAVLAHQASPYTSHRRVRFEMVPPPLGDLGSDSLLVMNYRKLLVIGHTEGDVRQVTEAVGRDGRPFEGSQLGWDGPWAEWVCEPVPSTLHLLQGLLRVANDYGLVDLNWLGRPLIYTAWLVPIVMEWDEDGRPVFSWPDRSSEPEVEAEFEAESVEV